MKTALRLLLVSAFVLLISVPAAFGQTPQVSTFPVDEPIDVGGTILQPGTYLIRVLPTLADRNRIQITDVDRTKVYATLLTIPHDLEPNEEVPNTMFVFFPAANGSPKALRTWFPPEFQWKAGKDIVYEQGRAKQLARLVNEPVPAYTGEVTETTTIEVVQPDETIAVYTPPAPAPVAVMTPAPEPVTVPEPMTSAQPEPAMPQTASNLPLIALLGLLSIATAVVLRRARHA